MGQGKAIPSDVKKKKRSRDFPGGPGVKSPPFNVGDISLIPGWGTKIPHASELATKKDPLGHNGDVKK